MFNARTNRKKNLSVILPLESLEDRRLMTITSWDLVSTSDSAYSGVPESGPSTGSYYSIRALVYYYNTQYNGEANQPFTIVLGNGPYTLSEVNPSLPTNGWEGRNDNSNYYGDLDINPSKTGAKLIIQGPVGGSAVLTANIVDSMAPLDRLIQVTGSLQLQNVTLKGGLAWDNGNGSEATDALGGAVLVNPGGILSLSNCKISSNAASATRSTHYGIAGLNAAGGGIYGSAGSNITLSGSNVFNANRAIAGKGGTSSTSNGLSGGNAFGAGLSMVADVSEPGPYSSSEIIPSTQLSINAESGTNTSFTDNRLNSYINTQGGVENSGGTGGAGSGTGGKGGNASGAGLYVGSGQLNLNGGSTNSPITFVGNQARGGLGASTTTGVSGANGTAYGAGVYYMPGQVTVANAPSSSPVSVSVPNYGFETPSLSDGTFTYGTTGASWSFVSSSGISNNNSGFTDGNPDAPQGDQVGILQEGGSFSQTISGFEAGKSYDMTFYAAQRAGYPQQSISVQLGGLSLGTFVPENTTYQLFRIEGINPGTGSYTLTFTGLFPYNQDETVFVDDVVITSETGILQFSNNSINNTLSSIYIPTVETSDVGYTSAEGPWTLRTAVAALNPLVATGMNLTLNLPSSTISLVSSSTGSNTGPISVANSSKGILSINGNGAVINGSNLSASIFSINSAHVSLSNLTITGGGGTSTSTGGGLTSSTSNVTLSKVIVSDNMSDNGGGLFNEAGTMNLSSVTITKNGVNGGAGGGIFSTGGTVNIKNSKITYNSAAQGGGAYLTSGTATMTGGTVQGNTAITNGGGLMSNGSSSLKLTNVSIVSNSATSSTGNYGGGLYQNNGGTLSLSGTTVKNNTGAVGAGILCYGSTSTFIAVSSNITNNTASVSGGGINLDSATVSISSSTISNNKASGNGGGVNITNCAGANFTAVSFSGNTANSGYGGGIYQNGGTVNIKSNSNFKNNSANQGGGAYFTNANNSIYGGVVQGNSATVNGGGLLSWHNTLKLTNVSVVSNKATSSSGSYGGGLYQNGGGSLIISGTTVKNNSAMDGGGILCDSSAFSATKSKIINNSATSVGAGFASLTNGNAMSFISATVSNNSLSNGGYAGGGLYLTNGTLNTSGNFNLINNSITSTTSYNIEGAGIYASGTTINFNGGASAVSMISKNSLTSNGSATGAGLYLTNSATLNQYNSLAIINNTITSNNGSNAGNGVGGGVAFASGASFNHFVSNALSIANGSFETPSQGSGYVYNPTNANWTFSGDSGITGSGGAWSLNNPPQGSQAAFLQSNNSIISQSISGFASGQAYVLYFQAALRPGYPVGQSIAVSMDGNSLGTYTPSSTAFQSFAVPLVGFAAGSHTLEFAGTSTGGVDYAAFLDNVQISTSAFGGNFASGGGNDMAFQVAYTGDNSNSAPSYASGINYFTKSDSTGSLRSAIKYAQQWMNGGSTSPTSMAIMLSPGTYGLSGSYGQLITQIGNCEELTILGSPASMSTVSASGMATRPFWIDNSGSGTVVLQNLNVSGGNTIWQGNPNGGGIYLSSGTLTLNNTIVSGNKAGYTGTAAAGGNSAGTANGHAANGGNGSNGASGYGGGIFMAGGTLNLLSNSSVTGNYVYGQNGGKGGNGQNGSVTFSQNGGYCSVHDTNRINGGNGGYGGEGGSAMGGGIYQYAGTLNSPSGSANIYGNTASPGAGGSSGAGGSGGSHSESVCSHTYTRTSSAGSSPTPNPYYSGSANANYDHAGGGTVFSSNSTASAQSIGGLYQSAGSINQAALPSASVPKRLPGVMIELYSDDGKLIATATTDQNGRYRFNTDYSGIGYLHVKPLKTFVVSEKGSQFSGGVTSAFDPTSGNTDPVQLINGVVVNTNLNLVLSKIDSGLIVKGNSIRLNRKGTHSALWQTQLMPKSYHGGFTLSTFDVNNDTTPDYVLITKTGKPMAFIVDARTGQSTKLGGQVASNLRNGFVVQSANVQGDSTKELILAPSRERSGRISVIDLQAKKVLWNATDFVLGGMKINQIGADPSGHSEYSSFQLVSLRQNDTFKILDGATGKLLETVSDRTRRAEERQAMKAEKMQSASIASVPNATQPTGLAKVSIPRRRLPVMN